LWVYQYCAARIVCVRLRNIFPAQSNTQAHTRGTAEFCAEQQSHTKGLRHQLTILGAQAIWAEGSGGRRKALTLPRASEVVCGLFVFPVQAPGRCCAVRPRSPNRKSLHRATVRWSIPAIECPERGKLTCPGVHPASSKASQRIVPQGSSNRPPAAHLDTSLCRLLRCHRNYRWNRVARHSCPCESEPWRERCPKFPPGHRWPDKD
jgi:hypothetical protein